MSIKCDDSEECYSDATLMHTSFCYQVLPVQWPLSSQHKYHIDLIETVVLTHCQAFLPSLQYPRREINPNNVYWNSRQSIHRRISSFPDLAASFLRQFAIRCFYNLERILENLDKVINGLTKLPTFNVSKVSQQYNLILLNILF